MTKVEGETNLYEVTVPAGSWTHVIFCRMNPYSSSNSWNNKWNQSADLTYDGTNNHYTVSQGAWEGGKGVWSTYSPAVPEEPTPEVPTTTGYALFGYINGANYGCEEDYSTIGEYVFENGKLTATFAQTSYVGVKTTDNASWYMTDGWAGEVTSVTLYRAEIAGDQSDKFMIPGGVELTFTLVENEDGSLSLSYVETNEPVVPETPYVPENGLYVAGNGEGAWMNGIEWNPAADVNKMSHLGDNIYEITYAGVNAGENYEFKIVANGNWIANWGAAESTPIVQGEKVEGVANAINNFCLAVEEDNSTVTIRVDLSKTYEITDSALVTVTVEAANSEVEEYITLNTDNMELGNSLAMLFWVDQSQLLADVDYTAKLTRNYANGTSVTLEVPESQWTAMQYDGKDYYQVKYNNFAAKEMTDTVSIQIFDEDGNAVSNVFTDSIRDYAMFALDYYTGPNYAEFRTVLVDMLKYGAAAQYVFNYNMDDMADSKLTADYIAQATPGVKLENKWSNPDGMGYGSNLALISNIMLQIWVKNVTPDMYAIVSYVNHEGVAVEYLVEFSAFTNREGYGAGIYSVPVNGLVVADGAQPVTVTMYKGSGEIVGTVTESVESYINYAFSSSGDTSGLYEATAKFTTSAYNYFH